MGNVLNLATFWVLSTFLLLSLKWVLLRELVGGSVSLIPNGYNKKEVHVMWKLWA